MPVETEGVVTGNYHPTFHEEPAQVEVTHEVAERKSASPMLDLVVEWLKANPDSTLSNREIAKLLGISHPWVGKAKKLLRGEE